MAKAEKIEVELRAKLSDVIAKKLNRQEGRSFKEEDTYYSPKQKVATWIARIRKRERDYFLTFKSKGQFGEGAWNEVDRKYPVAETTGR